MATYRHRWIGLRNIIWLLAIAVFLQLLVTVTYIILPTKIASERDTSIRIPNNKHSFERRDDRLNHRMVASLHQPRRKSRETKPLLRKKLDKVSVSKNEHVKSHGSKNLAKPLPVIKLPDELEREYMAVLANETKRARKARNPRRWPVPKGPGVVPKEWTRLQNSSGECSQCPFREKYGVFCLIDDNRQYTASLGNVSCLLEGTDWNVSSVSSHQGTCRCREGWRGPACSIPESVLRSDLSVSYKTSLTLRAKPRRIIYSFPFHMEFELFEARIAEFGDLVDVFLILESNFTAYGERKGLELLARLQDGAYQEIACKIVYIFLDYFPEEAYYDGNLADRLHRDHIGTQGVAKQLRDFRQDDIFLLSDADEIPKRETILFLKVHDGYPEPFGFYYHWNIFGFFWTPGRPTHVDVGLTMGMLIRVVGLPNTSLVKYYSTHVFDNNPVLNKYIRSVQTTKNRPVQHWDFGNFVHQAGWHCSWCFPPEGIRDKLKSAQNGDFPRWGDYPEKSDLGYIRTLVQKGTWFNDQDRFRITHIENKDYAPSHFMQNRERYHLLLNNVYRDKRNKTLHN